MGCGYAQAKEGPAPARKEVDIMSWLLILFIVIVIVVFGLGFVVKTLFWVALVLFILWIISLLLGLLRGKR
jgi:predicted membrane protein